MSLIREESLKAIGGEINHIARQGLSIDLHGKLLRKLSRMRSDDSHLTRRTSAKTGWD